MGLLNDAKKRRKMSTFIVDHHRKGIVVSHVIGIIWFLALASENLNNKTYFSENALLPGLVVREFNPGSSLNRILSSLKEEASNHLGVPYTWIQAQFRQMGLDVYSHNFTLRYPFGSKSEHQGVNMYAILRAPKSSSSESLILSTPYRGTDSIHDPTLASVALMIELARYFKHHTYWSKDIIFLITEHEMIGFQAWLNAYHNTVVSKNIESGILDGNSGLIQGVVNLEISSEHLSSIDIKIEGLNGQLPNLDLFNLAVELCARESVTSTFQTQKTYYSPSFTLESWQHDLYTMISMMGLQATGLTNGGHGLFHRYGIQAVTLKSINDNSQKVSLIHVGRVLEGMFRSLNNLLEKFHQSFFFYLLPSTRRYISIGLYMPPFVLIALPVLIKALYLFIESKFTVIKPKDLENDHTISLWSALDIIIISYGLGITMYFTPKFTEHFQNNTDLSTEDFIYYAHIFMLFLSLIFTFIYCKKRALTEKEYNIKMCVALLGLGAFLYTLSLTNISSATILSLIYVYASISLAYRCKFYLIQYIFIVLINPFMITYLAVMAQSYYNDSKAVWYHHFKAGFSGHKKILLYTLEDLYFFSNWNYKIFTLALLPLWYQLWMLQISKRS